MYQRIDWMHAALGRRTIDRLARGKARINPALVPEFVSWLRMQGNRYVELLSSMESRYSVRGDSFINSVRQTAEFRVGLIQDLINLTTDEFPLRKYLDAFDDTCKELDITEQDLDPANYLYTPSLVDGEGI